MRKRAAVFGLLLLGILGFSPPGSAQTSSGNIEGWVQDSQQAPLPGVTVTATQKDTGLSRVATTDSEGRFRLVSVPVGTYDLTIELAGYAVVVQEGVTVNVASTRSLEVTLSQSQVEETITVTSEAPLVTSEPAIGTVVSRQEIENLPLNGRQFANLGTLAPGTSLGINPDPTKPNQMVISVNGGIGRNVNYTVDGGDNMDDTIGGALQNFNLEAVQEFKIQTQQYKAEFGRSTGGVLSVVTKTGTNDLALTAYGFFRDRELNARTETEKRNNREASEYERQQWGGTVGGPIVTGKAHYFATYEQTDRTTAFVVNTQGIFPELDGDAFPLPFEDKLFTAKSTWDLSASQSLQARLGYQDTSGEKYSASPLSTPDNLGTINSEYRSMLVGHNWIFAGDRLNELVVQWTDFENEILADSSEPTRTFANGVADGQNGNTPQTTIQEKWQIRDDVSFSRSIGEQSHDFKAGINYVHVPTLGGSLSAGTEGQFTYLGNSQTAPISQIVFFGGEFQFETPVDQYSVYFQDDWRVSPRLTLNLGLRYDYWDGFDLDQRSNPIWQALSTQTTYNEDYLQDFQGGKGGQLENDDDNFGPRLGFTWDIRGDTKHLLRGGWGVFHDFPYTNATILFPTAAVQSNYGLVYSHVNPTGIRNADGSFYQFGQPLPPNQLTGLRLNPPNEVGSPTMATPKATQASLGYATELFGWLGVTVDLVNIDYRDIPFRFRANPFVDSNGNGRIDTGEPRRFPQFGNFRIWSGEGEADYEGANLGLRARVSQRLELQGFYTYSEASGNILGGTDEFRITVAGNQPDLSAVGDQSVNPLNPGCDACFGPLNTDAEHRFTLGAVYRAPWDLVVSGIYRYRSATPYTEWTGVDVTADGYAFDLAPGVSAVNNLRGASFSQLDMRLSREFRFGGNMGVELMLEVFNLLNEENPARFIGNRRATNFGQPTVFAGDPLQGEQRLAQIGLRFSFN